MENVLPISFKGFCPQVLAAVHLGGMYWWQEQMLQECRLFLSRQKSDNEPSSQGLYTPKNPLLVTYFFQFCPATKLPEHSKAVSPTKYQTFKTLNLWRHFKFKPYTGTQDRR